MGKMKKKYESGAATAFIGRNQAIKKLQLTIADFRRLCILKGVYPVEPKNKKKINKGSTAQKTFYYAKDITFLANEPIVNKFREFKVYVKRLKRAKGRRDIKAIGRIRKNKPTYKVDHIVKERYPTYTDAIRDLDDCLSLVFLFSILPKSRRIYVEHVQLCRKLSLEFMHYIIASKSLRKCFISIKGYYFQAEIKGQKVTWVMPHKLAYQTPDDVDFRIMSTFVEFYSIMLGFVNFKSYSDIGLIYPPKLSITSDTAKNSEDDGDFNDEYLASLNCDFLKITESADDEANGDEFPLANEENPDMIEKAKIEEENLRKLKNLFKGLKFFLNREIPREQFVFAIKSFSGEVSWDKTTGLGSTYQEDDLSITHHIVDRPVVGKTFINRVYVQPQWIFDSINENMLLPVDDYLPGALLPPHLSPFVEANEGDYIPPEKQRLIKMKLGLPDDKQASNKNVEESNGNKKTDEAKKDDKKLKEKKAETNGNNKNSQKSETKNDKKPEEKKNGKAAAKNEKNKADSESEEENEDDSEEDMENDMKVDLDSPEEEEESEESDYDDKEDEEEEKNKKLKKEKPMIAVVKAQPKVENLNMILKKQTDEDKKLSEMMIPKKNKRLYDKIMYSRKKQRQEVEKLKEKREKYEQSQKNPKKNKA